MRSGSVKNVVIIFLVLALGGSWGTGLSFAADKKADNKAKPAPVEAAKAAEPVAPAAPTVPQQIAPATPTVNPVTQAAVQAGVLTCTSRINQVASFLTNKTMSGAFLFMPSAKPDQQIFSSSFELQVPNTPSMYASASFAPNSLGACGAVYDTVEYTQKSCSELEKNTFKDLKRTGSIKKDIAILDASAVKIFLMPADKGCVVIRKEIVQ
jgi:hypothetical protein